MWDSFGIMCVLPDVHFCVFCHDDPKKVTNRVLRPKCSGPSTEKSWTPCERSSKIMGVPSPNDFWNVLSVGEKSVQRGPGHTEWRTPRFSNVAPQRRFGRRVLRTMKNSPRWPSQARAALMYFRSSEGVFGVEIENFWILKFLKIVISERFKIHFKLFWNHLAFIWHLGASW